MVCAVRVTPFLSIVVTYRNTPIPMAHYPNGVAVTSMHDVRQVNRHPRSYCGVAGLAEGSVVAGRFDRIDAAKAA